jgi:quercetin dioxygenase-like cupin family protein
VTVVRQVYEPGQASGWHAHSGIHAVAVLSGALTVFDGRCQAYHYGPGEPYVGGQELHQAVNLGPVPAELVVTYVRPPVPGDSTRPLDPPRGCAAGP